MACKFEFVEKYKDCGLPLPTRGTAQAAGYDLYVAEDIIIPSHLKSLMQFNPDTFTLEEMSQFTKSSKCRPTLVPTGVKWYGEPNQYLELSVRSSTPLKYWLVLANGIGIVDSDYADNPDNEGIIYLQIINLSPFTIKLQKGDRIGQAIIKTYGIVDSDNTTAARTGGLGSTGI